MHRTFKVCQLLAVIYLFNSIVVNANQQPTEDKNLDELIKEIFNIPNDDIFGGGDVGVREPPLTEPSPLPPYTVPVSTPTSQPVYHPPPPPPITQTPVTNHNSYQTEPTIVSPHGGIDNEANVS